jgi:hypothetical protein
MSLAEITNCRQRRLYRFILDGNQQSRHHSQNSAQGSLSPTRRPCSHRSRSINLLAKRGLRL